MALRLARWQPSSCAARWCLASPRAIRSKPRARVQASARVRGQSWPGTIIGATLIATPQQSFDDSQASARLRLIIANLPVIVYTVDREGIFTSSEGKGLQAPGQAVGTSAFEMYSAFPEVIDMLQRAIAGEALVQSVQVGDVAFETWYEPLRDQAGAVTEILGVAINITERMEAEAERLELQEQVITAQQMALRELSTPLLPIADQVLVLPIIGTVDSLRAQQLMETLLEGIATTQSAIAILDITGVSIVDTQVANALIRTAQAAQLLGAQVVLTGISAEVAQALVGLGVELRGIVTLGTLQAGIAYALAWPSDQR